VQRNLSMRKYLFCLLFVFYGVSVPAQQIKPSAFFVKDTMSLAEPVDFSLSVEYPSRLTVLFPDSTFLYAPFEFRFKRFFTTQTDSLTSKDSVIYTLASFEVDQIQSLSLPVFVVNKKDSTAIMSNVDSIVFAEMIPVLADSLIAKEDVSFVPVDRQFNYPYFIIGLTIIAVLVIIVAVIFGKKILLRWKIYRLNKKHQAFLAGFSDFDRTKDSTAIERLLVKWKKHAEFISRKPYLKLTTKEINNTEPDKEMHLALQNIDRSIYSSQISDGIANSFSYLKKYAQVIFEKRVKELENEAK